AAGAGHVCLEVTDGGPGIPPDVQARLFEPFFTTKPTGTGLGLPLCQSIVESHRGTIEVESRPGRGTTFRVRLPVADVSPSPDAPAARDGEAPVTGKRILLVDDEAAIRELLGDILAEDQHTVESAGDGREALQKLEHGAYDLVLVDMRMPGIDGPGLYRALAARRPESCAHFVFMTGDAL